MERVKIEILVPDDHVQAVLDALYEAGAGQIGKYDHCHSRWQVQGAWRPLPESQPFHGAPGTTQAGVETKVEVLCALVRARVAIQAARAAHPYEEPVIIAIPVLDDTALPDTRAATTQAE